MLLTGLTALTGFLCRLITVFFGGGGAGAGFFGKNLSLKDRKSIFPPTTVTRHKRKSAPVHISPIKKLAIGFIDSPRYLVGTSGKYTLTIIASQILRVFVDN